MPRVCGDAAVGEEGPAGRGGVLEAVVPGALGHGALDGVDALLGRGEAVQVGAEADHGRKGLAAGRVLAVQGGEVALVVAAVDAGEVPCFGEAGEEGAGDGSERGEEGCGEEVEEAGEGEGKACVEEVLGVHGVCGV